jgi:hypothetical protein
VVDALEATPNESTRPSAEYGRHNAGVDTLTTTSRTDRVAGTISGFFRL